MCSRTGKVCHSFHLMSLLTHTYERGKAMTATCLHLLESRPRCISMCPLEVLPSPTSAFRCSWTICCIIWVHQKYWLPTLFCQPKKIECVCLTLIVPVNCDPLHITLFDCRSSFPLSREHGGSLRSQVIQTQHKRLMHLWWTCLSGFGVLFAGMILDVWWQVSLRDDSVCLCLSVF